MISLAVLSDFQELMPDCPDLMLDISRTIVYLSLSSLLVAARRTISGLILSQELACLPQVETSASDGDSGGGGGGASPSDKDEKPSSDSSSGEHQGSSLAAATASDTNKGKERVGQNAR